MTGNVKTLVVRVGQTPRVLKGQKYCLSCARNHLLIQSRVFFVVVVCLFVFFFALSIGYRTFSPNARYGHKAAILSVHTIPPDVLAAGVQIKGSTFALSTPWVFVLFSPLAFWRVLSLYSVFSTVYVSHESAQTVYGTVCPFQDVVIKH